MKSYLARELKAETVFRIKNIASLSRSPVYAGNRLPAIRAQVMWLIGHSLRLIGEEIIRFGTKTDPYV